MVRRSRSPDAGAAVDLLPEGLEYVNVRGYGVTDVDHLVSVDVDAHTTPRTAERAAPDRDPKKHSVSI